MVSYYTELDTNFYLPVIDYKKINHCYDSKIMSDEFFNKYSILFEFINSIEIEDKIDNLDYDCSDDLLLLYNTLKEKLLVVSEIRKFPIEEMNVVDLEKYLLLCGEIIDSLYDLNLCKMRFSNYIQMMQLFNDALLDIATARNELVKCYLSNTWLIASNGSLYNTNSNSHVEAMFSNYYQEMKQKFFNDELFKQTDNGNDSEDSILSELNNPKVISNNGYVSFFTLDLLLHYKDYINFNKKVFDLKYLNIVTGMLELRNDLYCFLKKLNMCTINPKDELNKIILWTNDNYDDLLIRCCGVSKVIRFPIKKIVTSCLDYEDRFSEYIDKGWDINFISPIVINNEKGIVEKYSNDIMKIRQLNYYDKS